jgi:hypothetical protein
MSLYHNRQGLDCLIRALQNYLDEARAEAERRPLQPFPAQKEAESDLEHLQQLLRELPRPSIFLRALSISCTTPPRDLDLDMLIAARAESIVMTRIEAALFPLRPCPALKTTEADLEDLLEQARQFQAESQRPRSRKLFSRLSRMCGFRNSPTRPLFPKPCRRFTSFFSTDTPLAQTQPTETPIEDVIQLKVTI